MHVRYSCMVDGNINVLSLYWIWINVDWPVRNWFCPTAWAYLSQPVSKEYHDNSVYHIFYIWVQNFGTITSAWSRDTKALHPNMQHIRLHFGPETQSKNWSVVQSRVLQSPSFAPTWLRDRHWLAHYRSSMDSSFSRSYACVHICMYCGIPYKKVPLLASWFE